jgi:predicted ArsR family transcriptional regulator
MPPVADRTTLNVQPRQRREVYERLAEMPEGRSVKELLDDLPIPERELRETLRKLDEAGLARRAKTRWCAVPLDGDAQESGEAPGPA